MKKDNINSYKSYYKLTAVLLLFWICMRVQGQQIMITAAQVPSHPLKTRELLPLLSSLDDAVLKSEQTTYISTALAVPVDSTSEPLLFIQQGSCRTKSRKTKYARHKSTPNYEIYCGLANLVLGRMFFPNKD